MLAYITCMLPHIHKPFHVPHPHTNLHSLYTYTVNTYISNPINTYHHTHIINTYTNHTINTSHHTFSHTHIQLHTLTYNYTHIPTRYMPFMHPDTHIYVHTKG